MTIVTTYPRAVADDVTGIVPQGEAAVRPAATDYPLGYLRSLDGMRGLMTLAVVGAHAGLYPRYLPGAMILMDMFFAMSGYLITSLLLKEFGRRGRINFGKFYVRRLARLYPALATMLAAFVVACWFLAGDFRPRVVEALIAFFYVNNYWTVIVPTPVPFTGHLWSLAVEEHFYLVWPLVLSMLLARYGATRRVVALILLGALAFALLRIGLVHAGVSTHALYVLSHTRADAFLWGGAAALLLPLLKLEMRPRLCDILAWSLVPMLIFTLIAMNRLHPDMRWYYMVSPLFGAIPAVIALAAIVQPRRTFMHAFYETAPLVFIGRICYGLYVWHVPIMAPLHAAYGRAAMIFIGVPLTFAIATASYYWMERPFMRARPL